MQRKNILIYIITIIMFVIISAIDSNIKNVVVPNGIVSYQFCGFQNSCLLMLQSWSPQQKNLVLLEILLDYSFIALYVLSLISIVKYSKLTLKFQKLLTYYIYVAACCDVLENSLQIFGLQINDRWSDLSFVVAFLALVKFILLVVIMIILIFNWVIHRKDKAA